MMKMHRRMFLAMLACALCNAALVAEETAGRELQSSLIWAAAAPAGTQAYVAFRKSFELKAQPEHPALLDIFADSRYMLWVNGEQILRGPCRFNPKRPEFDSLDIKPYLHTGSNTLVVLVHHYPAINGRIMRHAPGLTARLEIAGQEVLRTDASWRCTPNTEYRPSPEAWSSIPDQIDGRLGAGEWTAPDFNDSAWQPAVAVDGNTWGALQPRALPLPRETELAGITLKSTGQKLKAALPLELGSGTTDWEFPGGLSGRWMWSKAPAKRVYFKAVWKNAVHGDGAGCAATVVGDNSFVLFVNGREVARNEDVIVGWIGALDLKDGDVITIDATDLESGDRTAGLFAAFAKGGKTVLGTTDFLCSTAVPGAAWRTAATLDGLEKPDPDNVHPAHVNRSGSSVLLDLGRMAMAYPVMELEADEGSVVQLQYALRCRDGRPFETYGIGTTYTARAGRQRFIAADQWCARYVTVTCTSGRVKILGLKMVDRRYPFERAGSFTCSEPLLTSLWDMAVSTIEATSDDAYGSDARERNEWMQDSAKASYNTTRVATAGPDGKGGRVWSDPRLLKNVLRHEALSQLPDGRMLGTFPTDRGAEDCHYFIDDYACQWFESLRLYYDATGDKAFVRELWPHLTAQMKWFLDRRTPRSLVLAREYTSFDNPLAYITCEGANINAFIYMALRDAEYLGHAIGETAPAKSYAESASALHAAYNQHFWNAAAGAYSAGYLDGKPLGPTVHAQLMALHYGLVPSERQDSTRSWFLANYKNPGLLHCGGNPDYQRMIDGKAGLNMPIMYYWAFHELYRMDSATMDREALGEMRRRWGSMVRHQQDAGTLSESFPDENGNGASESCHNYGAVPAYFLSSYVLGVRLNGPVWEKTILLEPRLGDLAFAEGVVVTEHGPVPVSWKTTDGGKTLAFGFTVPKGVTAAVRLPKLSEAPSLTLNGKALIKQGKSRAGVRFEGRWLVVDKVTDACSGELVQ